MEGLHPPAYAGRQRNRFLLAPDAVESPQPDAEMKLIDDNNTTFIERKPYITYYTPVCDFGNWCTERTSTPGELAEGTRADCGRPYNNTCSSPVCL